MYEKILIPLDGSKESECIIDHVAMLAKSCGVPGIVLLRVLEPWAHAAAATYLGEETVRNAEEGARRAAEEYLSYISEPLRSHCGGVQTAVVQGRAAEAILDYAEKNDVDLIAMSTHGASGPTRWAMGSVTQKVMSQAGVPLLTVTPSSCRP
ncbi:MAG: universal stress protein [Chloroflexota bacterium]